MIHVKDLKKLYQVFRGEGIDQIEIRNGEDKVSLSLGRETEGRKSRAASAAAPAASAVPAATPAPAAAPAAAEEPKSNLYELKSNWIGFFIRINPKTGENYLKLRDVVKKGDIVGHVRVLGVLQDLRAEQPGKLKEVLVEEGQPVEYGQPLMRFEIQ